MSAPYENFPELLAQESDSDLFENAPNGYLLCMPDGTIIRANRTLLTWTGHDAKDLIGERFQNLLATGDRIFYETHYAPLLRMQGGVREIAVELTCADGSKLPILANSIMTFDANGLPMIIRTSIFGAIHRREYERELFLAKEQAEASKEQAKALAQTLQESLMPPSAPQMGRVEVGTAFHPAGNGSEIGGDFYDFFETATGDWSVVIGDVGGKGAAAAAITALARYSIRAAAITSADPATALGLLNDSLLISPTHKLCTAIYGRLQQESDSAHFRFAVAGHPLPLLVKSTREVIAVGQPGMLLGAFDNFNAATSEVTLTPGDSLVMFTDGITEARINNDFFEEGRVRTFLSNNAHLSAIELASQLADEVLNFQGGFAKDDLAVVVFHLS